MSDEPPHSKYTEVLSGKWERTLAHTGMTPPAKSASPSQQGNDRDDQGSDVEAVESMIGLRVAREDEDLKPPLWSADEEEESLLQEALEEATNQLDESAAEAKQGAKRSLTPQIQIEEARTNPKRMREDFKIHAIFLTPRHPEQVKGKNIPPIAATRAFASELLNVSGE